MLMLRPRSPSRSLTALALIAFALTACQPAALAPITLSPVAAPPRATLISPSLTEIGIQIVPISTLPAAQYQQLKSSAIVESLAIANARPNVSFDTNQPNTVEAILALYTNFHHGDKDIFAWIVTFKGVIYLPGGLQPETNTEANVVIDARTGKVVEGFSYR